MNCEGCEQNGYWDDCPCYECVVKERDEIERLETENKELKECIKMLNEDNKKLEDRVYQLEEEVQEVWAIHRG
jgi:predicted RNase H-like nuclease (RuvC/YqgF family)